MFIFLARILTVIAVLLPHIVSPHALEGTTVISALMRSMLANISAGNLFQLSCTRQRLCCRRWRTSTPCWPTSQNEYDSPSHLLRSLMPLRPWMMPSATSHLPSCCHCKDSVLPPTSTKRRFIRRSHAAILCFELLTHEGDALPRPRSPRPRHKRSPIEVLLPHASSPNQLVE